MVISRKLEIEGLFLIMAGIAVGAFFVFQPKSNQPKFFQPVNFPAKEAVATAPTAVPTAVFVPQNSIVSQISSDGTKKVVMKITENEDATRIYEISNEDDGPIIFSKTLTQGNSLSIPYNTWSPDNRYFFIQEKNENGQIIRVFKDKGETFAEGVPYLDLTEVYKERASGNIFDEATGWGAENLIVINTKLEDNTQGSSYWFEVPSKALIQLSTKF